MNIGNHLLAYLHAEFLANYSLRRASLHFDSIPQLGVFSENRAIPLDIFKADCKASCIYLRSRNRFLWPQIMILISRLTSTKIQINHPMMSLKRLPTLQKARSLVPGTTFFNKQALKYVGEYIHSHLFVNIRAGDILSPIHRNYRPLSLIQIAEASSKSNKPLLFFGQTESSPYLDTIKQSFPSSIFIYTNCPFTDFEINRSATSILIPISTFAWISTWLSNSTTQIFFPFEGLYSYYERPDVYLIPHNDSRYVRLKT